MWQGHLDIVQQGMGLLAFPLDTFLQPYKDLLDSGRWQQLIEQFRCLHVHSACVSSECLSCRSENYRLHQLSSQSMFTVALQVTREHVGTYSIPTWTQKVVTIDKIQFLLVKKYNSLPAQSGLACLKTPHCYRQTSFVLSGLPGLVQVG